MFKSKTKEKPMSEKFDCKIMIVDDEQVVRETMGKILSDEGFNVFIASDAKAAIEIAKNNTIDVALIDVRLPGGNGVDVFEKMKSIRPKMKAVIMTGYEVAEQIDRAFRLGAFACLHKPFDMENLLNLIDQMKDSND